MRPVSVKAKRAEGLGAIGRVEGIACLAVVLLTAAGVSGPPRRRRGPAPARTHRPAGRGAATGRASAGLGTRCATGRGAGRDAVATAAGRARHGPAAGTDWGASRSRDARPCASCSAPDAGPCARSGSPRISTRPRRSTRSNGWPPGVGCGSCSCPGPSSRGRRAPTPPRVSLAHARPLEEVELETLCRDRGGVAPFLLVLDGVTDPHNVGALLRSAECAGVTGVVLPRHRAVHVTPTVAKVAAGAIEHLDIAVVARRPQRAAPARRAGRDERRARRRRADRRCSTSPSRPSAGVALVMGAEGRGLASLTRRRCSTAGGHSAIRCPGQPERGVGRVPWRASSWPGAGCGAPRVRAGSAPARSSARATEETDGDRHRAGCHTQRVGGDRRAGAGQGQRHRRRVARRAGRHPRAPGARRRGPGRRPHRGRPGLLGRGGPAPRHRRRPRLRRASRRAAARRRSRRCSAFPSRRSPPSTAPRWREAASWPVRATGG